ncbi:MAG TPA: accessory factor UbiK family protein [Pseudomonadales bacterium]|nr:accessory factor UbiK family protein [Pseudomonadales bacterium]
MAIKIPGDLLAKLSAQLQEQLGSQSLPGEELEKILHALLQSALARLDLVSRSEFDAQCNVLSKTRSRLEEAEKQLAALCEGQAVRFGQTR